MTEIGNRLTKLRNQAGLGRPAVAKFLDIAPSTYQHYEARFKKEFLPLDLILPLADLFSRHGVDRGAVMELAGVGINTSPLDRELMRDVIAGLLAFTKDERLELTPVAFADIAVELYQEIAKIENHNRETALSLAIGPIVRLEKVRGK